MLKNNQKQILDVYVILFKNIQKKFDDLDPNSLIL
jgi:hypothetical protein